MEQRMRQWIRKWRDGATGADVSFRTGSESLYHTSIADPSPDDASRIARTYPVALREYRNEDIREVRREGRAVTYARRGKGNLLGTGNQTIGVYEVVVDTGVEHVGVNPLFETYAAKLFRGQADDSHYGQWQEKVHALADYYGGFICQFYGYCRNYGSAPEEGFWTRFEVGFWHPAVVFASCCGLLYTRFSIAALCTCFALAMTLFLYAKRRGRRDSEKGSFCILMRKYDGSLRDVIDEEMHKKGYIGRPLLPGVALAMICQIALGMWILHRENVLHRDLKADNVFVHKDADDNMPWAAYIGDFDISENTMGSAYWRAPEVLDATARRARGDKIMVPWTPMADVYSFGMTCYEILTGDIPLRNHPRREYEDVCKRGLRPELPADLNPDVKKLVVRCWHQDPLRRPSFETILSELKEMLHEFPEFLELFDVAEMLPPLTNRPSTEESISMLEGVFKNFHSKYPVELFVQRDEVDFVQLGFRFLRCARKLVRKFGYKPYIDHPSLPWSLWFSRFRLIHKLRRLSLELGLALPYFEEKKVTTILSKNILDAIGEGEDAGSSWTKERSFDEAEMLDLWRSWSEKEKGRHPPVNRHHGCVMKNNYGHYGGDNDYPICDFCAEKKPPRVKNAENPTFRMFDDKFTKSHRCTGTCFIERGCPFQT